MPDHPSWLEATRLRLHAEALRQRSFELLLRQRLPAEEKWGARSEYYFGLADLVLHPQSSAHSDAVPKIDIVTLPPLPL